VSVAEVTVGVDVGGTKIAAGAYSAGRLGEITLARTTHESTEALLEQIVWITHASASRLDRLDAVGVSVAGEVRHRDGIVVSASHLPISDCPLAERLAARLGVPVALDNDGNCAAIAEAHLDRSEPARDLVMVTLGTGVGGGVIAAGRVLRGRTGIGAELGHLVLDAAGPRCFGACPGRGCLEALCSGTALVRNANALGENEPTSQLGVILTRAGTLSAEDVVSAAQQGDPQARALLHNLGRWLGVALNSLINIFEPSEIAIGGGLSTASEWFLPAALEEARSRTGAMQWRAVKIGIARAGTRASIAGAALLGEVRLLGASASVNGCSAPLVERVLWPPRPGTVS
jgi:glucokinase